MCKAFLTSPLLSQFIWAVLLMQGGTSPRVLEELTGAGNFSWHFSLTPKTTEAHELVLRYCTYLVFMVVSPVVPKQKTHGPLVDSAGSSLTLTIQVKGILIKSTIIHETKGHINLWGDEEVKYERLLCHCQIFPADYCNGEHVPQSCTSQNWSCKSCTFHPYSNLCSGRATNCTRNISASVSGIF